MIHDLLPLAKYTELPTGAELATWGRTSWTFTARLARPAALDPAASVIIESSPRAGDDADWSEVATLSLEAASPASKQTATLPITERYVRARVTGDTAKDTTFWVTAEAPFVLTTGDDLELFSKELRQWADGFTRTVEQAEHDVIRLCTVRQPGSPADEAPTIDYGFTLPGAVEAMRIAIVAQAEHLFRRYRLTQTNDPTAAVTLRQYADVAPVVSSVLSPYRSSAINAWRGR